MGFRQLEIKMKTDYTKKDLEIVIRKILKIRNFAYEIVKQSLDGRDNTDIHWMVRVNVTSLEIPNNESPKKEHLIIPRNVGKGKKVVIVGSGPAGMFAALVLQTAGYKVTIIEQGPEVYKRTKDIKYFEKTGELIERSNYSYGEGGAGTFSDGKLTSRTKAIAKEKDFILEKYVEFGGPEEILYLSKPHLGSNLLIKIVKNFRNELMNNGVEIHFNTKMLDLKKRWGKITKIETEKGWIDGDYFIIAPGHSSFETYKLLINNGVQFKLKNFAIGTRVEHYQENINRAKWSVPKLPGVKAADYSVTYNFQSILSVYSFCMCPGGKVVPAPPTKGLNIVNGMSNYKRNYKFGNSAIVAGVSIPMLVGEELEPLEALEWLMALEQKFYEFSNSYKAPAVKVSDFINKRNSYLLDSSPVFQIIKFNPFSNLKEEKPTINNEETAFLTEEECRVLLNSIDTSTILGLRNKALLSLALTTALRKSEIINIKLKDIVKYGDYDVIKVTRKGNKLDMVKLQAEPKIGKRP